ncbi:MAG: ribonuclease HI [Prochloraceae cyanobacterium]|nr:ribonuclease HI [Prochloraceae cyanobacterium]
MKISRIYTDGACIGNPGPGGWGVVIYFSDGSVAEMGEREAKTTNNRMEMAAAIGALKFFADCGQKEPITLYTDSEYLKKGVTQWIHGWKKKNWRTSAGKPVVNQDLWQILDRLNSKLIQWKHVRGHSGNEGNERCDEIARGYATGNPPALKQISASVGSDVIAPINQTAVTGLSDLPNKITIINEEAQSFTVKSKKTMIESSASAIEEVQLPREVRVTQLNNLIETLRIADEIATKGYLISSSELADLMDINASAVTSRGDHWSWRNWVVSRVRREGNQILWQLERVD